MGEVIVLFVIILIAIAIPAYTVYLLNKATTDSHWEARKILHKKLISSHRWRESEKGAMVLDMENTSIYLYRFSHDDKEG